MSIDEMSGIGAVERLVDLGNQARRRELLRFDHPEIPAGRQPSGADQLLLDRLSARNKHGSRPRRQQLADGVEAGHRQHDVGFFVPPRQIRLEIDALDVWTHRRQRAQGGGRLVRQLRAEDERRCRTRPAVIRRDL